MTPTPNRRRDWSEFLWHDPASPVPTVLVVAGFLIGVALFAALR